MDPARRLASALLVLVAGAVLALIGAVTRWYTVAWPGRTVEVPEFGTVRFPARTVEATGGDLSRVITGTAVGMLFVALLAAMAGRRSRPPAVALAIAAAGVLAAWSVAAGGEDAIRFAPVSLAELGEPTVTEGAGRWTTVAGAMLAAVAGLWALTVAGRVGRLRMPEGAPADQGGASRAGSGTTVPATRARRRRGGWARARTRAPRAGRR